MYIHELERRKSSFPVLVSLCIVVDVGRTVPWVAIFEPGTTNVRVLCPSQPLDPKVTVIFWNLSHAFS